MFDNSENIFFNDFFGQPQNLNNFSDQISEQGLTIQKAHLIHEQVTDLNERLCWMLNMTGGHLNDAVIKKLSG